MKESENFIVKEPYQPTEDEKKAIAELKAKGLKPQDWKSKKKVLSLSKKICSITCILNRIPDVHIAG